MILFSTHAAEHLARTIAIKHGACTIKKFIDGEISVQINEDVQGKQVAVLASTQAPGDNMLELFFLLDALIRAGAQVHLFISYFAYARQIVAKQGQALSAQVISTILKEFRLQKLYILHVHSQLLHEFLPFTDVVDIDFFCEQARSFDVIAAPDKGALALASEIAHKTGKELIEITKKRYDDTMIEIIAIDGHAAGKKILLVDDIISSGNTMVQAAQELVRLGAHSVAAAATHGLFSGNSRAFLESSVLEKIFVTNSIAQEAGGKIVVVEIHRFVTRILQQ